MRPVRPRLARRLKMWGDHLEGNYWQTDAIFWTRHRPRRFRSADELRGLCQRVEEQLGTGSGVTLHCLGGPVAAGPDFEGLADGLDRYSPEDRRQLILSENERTWTISFGNSWRTAAIPLSLEAVGLNQDESVRGKASNVTTMIDRATKPYRRWHRTLRAPLVEAYTGRDVRTRAHDLKVTAFAVVGGLLAGGLSGWLAGVLARPPS